VDQAVVVDEVTSPVRLKFFFEKVRVVVANSDLRMRRIEDNDFDITVSLKPQTKRVQIRQHLWPLQVHRREVNCDRQDAIFVYASECFESFVAHYDFQFVDGYLLKSLFVYI
jgi:hypothetical protein